MGQWFYHPDLRIEALVKRPEAERVRRMVRAEDGHREDAGEVWFFRLAIKNEGRTPARNVQVFLEKVETADGHPVIWFSPMNLKWTHTGAANRAVLLRKIPVFCDFIHVGDPAFRQVSGEDIEGVPLGRAVLCLDVEVTSSAKGHLLVPGAYRFHLIVAAENSRERVCVVEVHYNGAWFMHQDQMFNEEIGFAMRKL